jgi:hypothetical protein
MPPTAASIALMNSRVGRGRAQAVESDDRARSVGTIGCAPATLMMSRTPNLPATGRIHGCSRLPRRLRAASCSGSPYMGSRRSGKSLRAEKRQSPC